MKKNLLRIIAILVLVGLLAAVLVYKFVYNKPHRDYSSATPDVTMTASALYDAYVTDKDLADSLYTGKVVQIDGNLSGIEDLDTLVVGTFIFNEGMFGDEGIRFSMLPADFEKLRAIEPGTALIVKGYCEGYNMADVLLGYSSIVE